MKRNLETSNFRFGGYMTLMAASFLMVVLPLRADEPSADELVKQANQSWHAGHYDEAMQGYEKASERFPNRPEITFNRGVTHYRKKEWEKAENAFTEALATRDPALEAKIKYNMGNCAYARAVEQREQVNEATKLLETAINRYRDCLDVDPNDADAKRNIESAQLLMKDLLDQQNQQKNQASQPASQPESQPSSQPESRPSSQPESQPASQPKQPEQQTQDQPGQQGSPEKQDQQKQESPQAGQNDKKDGKLESANQANGDKEKEDPDKKDGQPPQMIQIQLSQEEAEKLLQMIRDKERERREMLNQRLKAADVPVDKDW